MDVGEFLTALTHKGHGVKRLLLHGFTLLKRLILKSVLTLSLRFPCEARAAGVDGTMSDAFSGKASVIALEYPFYLRASAFIRG
jgi:hypothetical protein